jgi:signal transduction histidine kinase
MAGDGKDTKNKSLFLRPKKLKGVLEHVNQEMYVRNLQLTQTNRTLSLLREIDNLVLESQVSTRELCNEMSLEISKSASYPFVGVLVCDERKKDEFQMYGWNSRISVDNPTHKFVDDITVAVKDLPWLESPQQSINLPISDLIKRPRSLAASSTGKRALGVLQSMGVKSIYIVKMMSRNRIVGLMVVGLLSDAATAGVMSNDEDLILRLGSAVGIAIDNKLLIDENEHVVEQLKKTNDKLKALDETKDEFLSMASHQLRTPLTSIKGYISMVLEGDGGRVTPQQQKLLVEAFKSSERMVGLIGDFLNVSRLQTGKFVIEKTPFDLKSVVKQEVTDLELIASSHDIKLRLKTGAGKFPVVADEQKIRQVIMNFIDNSIYYSHPNSTIVINLERLKTMAALTVVDTGIGVPKEEQERLFNKFFRAKNARKQRPDGTGVGLYLAGRVVKAHDGEIIFSSVENKGSTFGFKIPLAES